jgi:hypothetical protein
VIRRPVAGQDAKVARLKRAALAAILPRIDRTAAYNEYMSAKQDITWEEID